MVQTQSPCFLVRIRTNVVGKAWARRKEGKSGLDSDLRSRLLGNLYTHQNFSTFT